MGAAVGVGLVLGLWVAMHRVPWIGPMVADGMRSVIGTDGVAKLEDFVYGLSDRVNLAVRDGGEPQAYWPVPRKAVAALPATELDTCAVPAFAPAEVGPVHARWSAPGDGVWVGLSHERRSTVPATMYKTLLHPDAQRSWTAVSVVAVDLRRVDLHLVAGRHEPKAETADGRKLRRTGLIPAEHHDVLLAAFNGGFKAEHGHYGMHVDGVTLIPPRSLSCWVAKKRDGSVLIGDYQRLAARQPDTLWWRQTPGCMIDEGDMHPGLRDRSNTYWGATLSGKTVIRRSALGLSRDGKVLYSGIGDHVNARAMAVAMKHAGANHVAQLDVNWSYPKFVLFERSGAGLKARKLCDGFEFSDSEYIGTPGARDFFYLTKKSDRQIEAAGCSR